MLKVASLPFILLINCFLFAQKQPNNVTEKNNQTIESYQKNKEPAEPKFKFEEEVFDYGKISVGSNGLRSFRFENTGNKVLIVDHIETSCGCTVAKKPEKPVLPGEKDSIVVRYNTIKPGFFQKSLKIHYNHSNDSIKRISIKGTVVVDDKEKEEQYSAVKTPK